MIDGFDVLPWKFTDTFRPAFLDTWCFYLLVAALRNVAVPVSSFCEYMIDSNALQGVLALNVSIPGLGKRFMLTRTLEWNLYWCILDPMLGPDFHIKEEFKHDIARLQRRFR